MTIYVTPFRNSDKQATDNSISSGFESIDAVVAAMGNEYIKKTNHLVVYGDEDRVVFSDFKFNGDGG